MSDHNEHCCRRFKDQVAVVVGAAHGIGKAIAKRLGKEGAKVVMVDMDREGWKPPAARWNPTVADPASLL